MFSLLGSSGIGQQVGADRVLDALEGLPAYVAFVGLRDQGQPLLAGLAPIALARRAALVARRALALTVGVCAARRYDYGQPRG